MLCWYCYHLPLLLYFLFVLPLPILGSNATCPYDLDIAFDLILATYYANATVTAAATAGSTTTVYCCFIFIAYIYTAIRHTNLAGTAFLLDPEATTYSLAFSTSLICCSLICPSLLNSSNSYNLSSDFDAGHSPCLYSTVSTICSTTDLSNASLLCAASQSDLYANQSTYDNY